MTNLCYCPVCQCEREFVIVKQRLHYETNEVNFDYDEKVTRCISCKEELFVKEYNDLNQASFEEAYKNSLTIISKDDIEEILKKYNITKRNLSIVLGLGELTITRYLDGYIPRKKNSDLLKEVLKSPEVYLKYLNQNKNNIKNSVYIRSKNKVDSVLGINYNDKKLEDVVYYIIKNNEETTPMVLQKLLYYVDLFYMVFHGEKLFKSPCSAWDHGPVYGRIFYEFKECGYEQIDKDIEEITIEDELRELLDEVIESFGIYSGKVLAYFTHQEHPWKNARENNEMTIDEKSMMEFAKRIKTEYEINSYQDIVKYSDMKIDKYKTRLESKTDCM